MVDVLSYIKDWELANSHMQHNLERDTTNIESILESISQSLMPNMSDYLVYCLLLCLVVMD
jgi:hypothetical protein|uniref:Uncharacterized protein n=1 Tax=Zea mays TaxID=4577 RepID=B6SMP1_MAIZE|nr:hypothetical protein [Zea mays]